LFQESGIDNLAYIEVGEYYRPYMNKGTVCGDVGLVEQFDDQCFIALTDGLGHGEKAYEAANLAKKYIHQNTKDNLVILMKKLHEKLKRTRGGVTSILLLDIKTGKLEHVGIGNITARVIGKRATTLLSKDGVVGYTMSSPSKNTVVLEDNDIILVYSDGVSTRIDFTENRALLKKPAREIAKSIVDIYGKQNDDNSCIVIKYFK
jgi:phosphoserine phosphatase RsbX